MNNLKIDAAIGPGHDLIGQLLKKHDVEDGSGIRRSMISALRNKNFELAARNANCTEAEVIELRAQLVELWGEPDA